MTLPFDLDLSTSKLCQATGKILLTKLTFTAFRFASDKNQTDGLRRLDAYCAVNSYCTVCAIKRRSVFLVHARRWMSYSGFAWRASLKRGTRQQDAERRETYLYRQPDTFEVDNKGQPHGDVGVWRGDKSSDIRLDVRRHRLTSDWVSSILMAHQHTEVIYCKMTRCACTTFYQSQRCNPILLGWDHMSLYSY